MQPLPLWSRVIPQPRTVTHRSGAWPVPKTLLLWSANARTVPAAQAATHAVQRICGAAWGLTTEHSHSHVSIELAPASAEAASAEAGPASPLYAQQATYRLRISGAGIQLHARNEAGVAAGLATLAQAVMFARETSSNDMTLPCVEIEDSPTHPWRGFMLDVARHFFPMRSLVRFLDLLWLFRYNRFHLHLSDDQGWRLPVEGYPLLTEIGAWRHDGTSEHGRYGGFYTPEELTELDRAAAALGVIVVPEIDLPGHASAALSAYPELGCTGQAPGVQTRWGIFESVICPVGETSSRFVDAVFSSLASIFEGPYIHTGGDEVVTTHWHSCPACREYLQAHGLSGADELYQTIVRTMTESILAQGKRPLVWDEASRLDLPPETIIVNWRTPEFAVAALERGYDIVLAPEGKRAYLDHKTVDDELEAGRLGVCTVHDSASFEPGRYLETVLEGSGEGRGQVLGGQANLWTEAVPCHSHAEYMALVRLAAISEGLWYGRPGADDWEPRFSAVLEHMRQTLFSNGYNVYPGPL